MSADTHLELGELHGGRKLDGPRWKDLADEMRPAGSQVTSAGGPSRERGKFDFCRIFLARPLIIAAVFLKQAFNHTRMSEIVALH